MAFVLSNQGPHIFVIDADLKGLSAIGRKLIHIEILFPVSPKRKLSITVFKPFPSAFFLFNLDAK